MFQINVVNVRPNSCVLVATGLFQRDFIFQTIFLNP